MAYKSKITEDIFTIPEYLTDLSDLIEEELENVPPTMDKRSKEFKDWKKRFGVLLDTYNSKAGFKVYCDVASIV